MALEKKEKCGNACMYVCVHAGVRACMRAYVCTEDGGAGRKRGGDSVCEKENENMQLATLSN